jgi:ABC-type transporter Mla MlaB component
MSSSRLMSPTRQSLGAPWVEQIGPNCLFVHREQTGDAATIVLRGTLDDFNAEILARVLAAVDPTLTNRVELDLTQLQLIDSRGVEVVLAFHAHCLTSNAELTVCAGAGNDPAGA